MPNKLIMILNSLTPLKDNKEALLTCLEKKCNTQVLPVSNWVIKNNLLKLNCKTKSKFLYNSNKMDNNPLYSKVGMK